MTALRSLILLAASLFSLVLSGQWIPTDIPERFTVNGVEAQGDTLIVNLGGAVFLSTNEGSTVNQIFVGDRLGFTVAPYLIGSVFYITNSSGQIYPTTDLGRTYQTIIVTPPATNYFTKIFEAKTVLWASNGSGVLYRSFDGPTFTPASLNTRLKAQRTTPYSLYP